MSNAMSIALSALTADATAIDVVGNNLANLNTTGFKASKVNFEDLMSQSMGVGSDSSDVGMGVGQITTAQNFSQGTITSTNGSYDAAIQGDGFFVVKDQNNATLYTRAGNFQVDASGNLVTIGGDNVQGWPAVNGAVNPNGPVSNITIPIGSVTPTTPTANMSMNVNLNAAAVVGGSNATFSAPIQVFDSLGTAHTLTVNYTKTDANTWGYTVTIPAADTSGSPTLASGTMTFDSTGALTAPASPVAISATGLTDGAADMSINWNLADGSGNSLITQYSEASNLSSPVQDGAAAGQVSKVTIENGGLILATFSNGQQVTMGQLALASIANPTSLVGVGNNNLRATAATAQVALGAAGTGGRGEIAGGALESSTTDMAAQFVNLLSYERSYQAASRVITSADQLVQETVNLIHP